MFGWLSKILSKFQPVYVQRVEFAAHLGWSIVIGLVGAILDTIPGAVVIVIWIGYSIFDEFKVDGYKGKEQGYDTFWDLGSKLIPSLIALIYVIIRGI